jgi:enamine deaminase RidA (YjgF/YER057c/UK114 family)
MNTEPVETGTARNYTDAMKNLLIHSIALFLMLVQPALADTDVAVVKDKALAHTAQILPVDAKGNIVGTEIDEQFAKAFTNLVTALEEVGSGYDQLIRLNVYATSDAHLARIRGLLPNEMSFVRTAIVSKVPHPNALVTLDAIATVTDSEAPVIVSYHSSKTFASQGKMAHVAVLPKGRTLYISGMADTTQDLHKATVGTMDQLKTVLALNGASTEHVVHLKAYMKPMDQVDTARNAMAESFRDIHTPPMTFIEWLNGIPIEIELIAYLPGEGDGKSTVDLRWQPEEKRSPVYCRFAIVDSPTRIYTKGYLSGDALDPEGQVRSIYAQLQKSIEPHGSDFEHLVKATYLVAAEDTSSALNAIRPELYNPERPPAASKASIASTGDPKRTILIDMIAVPK